MGFGTVFTMLTFLLVFSGMIVVVVQVQQGFADAQQALATHQSMLIAAQQEELRITETAYVHGAVNTWLTTYDEEFEEGTFGFTHTEGDSVALADPDTQSTGNFTSRIYDTGHSSTYLSIFWTSVEPNPASISFQVRSANDTATLQSLPFVGPDGTPNTFYTSTGDPLNDMHDTDRYIQWYAFFDGRNRDPILHDVSITLRRSVGNAIVEVENAGERKLDYAETDAYVDGVRVLRDDSERILVLQEVRDPRLWNPGERMNLTVFTNISTQKTVTVTNRHGRDEAVVSP